jgi:ATP-dependent DNA ligase
MYADACRMGLEGIVSKRRDRAYKAGRCAHWLKILNPDYERR